MLADTDLLFWNLIDLWEARKIEEENNSELLKLANNKYKRHIGNLNKSRLDPNDLELGDTVVSKNHLTTWKFETK